MGLTRRFDPADPKADDPTEVESDIAALPTTWSTWVAPAVLIVQRSPAGQIRWVAPPDRSSGCPSDRVRLAASWESSMP